MYVVGTCIILNIKDCCYILRFQGFSASYLNLQTILHFILIDFILEKSSNITIFQQSKV